MINVEEFSKLWGEEARYKEQEEFWNYRAAQFNQQMEDEEHLERVTKLMAWLKGNNALQSPGRILDIGCGSGKYAIPFAQAGHEVVGIDISSAMIQYAKENADKYGVKERTQFDCDIWEELDVEKAGWTGAFDLTFASMTPAIRNEAALDKMIRCSRGGCFLSSSVSKHEPIAERLRALLQMNKDQNFHMQRIYAVFNILWLKGYFPTIFYVDSSWENQFTLEEAIEHFRLFLRINPVDDPQLDQIIASTLQEMATEQADHLIRQEVHTKVAWLYWNVN